MSTRPRRPTLRDIAAETGLSSAAVSYALRGLQVPVETQERVREAAERLGYQADPAARALASGRTGYVGVLCGSLEDIWQQGIAAGLGRALLQAGKHGLIVDASNDPEVEAVLAEQLVAQRVDALICLPVDPRAPHWVSVAERTVLVSIGESLPDASAAAEVVFDNAGAVRHAITALAAVGHRDIAVLTPVATSTPDRPAESVVPEVAAELGVTATLTSAPLEIDGASQVARGILTATSRPSAMLCLADFIAYGVYDAARRLGLDIPGDLSVMGFDDNQLSRLLSPPLSSYRWPVDELVASVVARTLRAVDEGKHSRRKVLAFEPQARASVAAPSP